MCTNKPASEIIKHLQKLSQQSQFSIAKAVAIEALSKPKQDIPNFFEDLLKHGCISGMVSSLVYYTDTEVFFDKHYYEIMDLKISYEERLEQPMHISYNLKNHLAWFAFEQVARRIYLQ